MRTTIIAAAMIMVGCASTEEAVGESAAALQVGEMIVYEPGHPVPQDELTDLGSPKALGGTVLEGDPHIFARIDYAEGALLGGVFQSTRGKGLIHFPFTEHATILVGEVAMTDEEGHHYVLKPGDSYLVRQGSNIVWDVKGARVQKSFLDRTEAADAPGPMIVYRKGSVAADGDLVDLGSPAALGGTVLAGDPHVSVRIDYANEGVTAGVFQGTRGVALVHYPFTEHATVLRGEFTLTDETGQTHRFHAGDSYLIRQDSDVRWEVRGKRVQKSFLNFTQP